MKSLLARVDVIVTFNGEAFDFLILEPYGIAKKALMPKSVDLLQRFTEKTGHRIKLDELAHWTLGKRKTGAGIDAVKWWREGKYRQVIEYCKKDVCITQKLYVRALAKSPWRYIHQDGGVRILLPDIRPNQEREAFQGSFL